MPTTVTIPIPSYGPSYVAGARLFGVLAYPPTSISDQKWRNAELALCRSVLQVQQELEPDWAKKEQSVIPEHLLFPATDLPKKLEKIESFNRHRLGAAHVAVPFFRQALRARAGKPTDIRRAPTIDMRVHRTIDQEADREDWLTERGVDFKPRFPKNDHNFESRVFRPSLPVLHIAVAVAVAIDRSQKALRTEPPASLEGLGEDRGGLQFHFGHFLTQPDLVRWVVETANEYEDLLPFLPKPEIKDYVQLRLEYAH